MSKPLPGRAFTIEELPEPIAQITHRVIGHTLGSEHPYVLSIGTLDECKAQVRYSEDQLRRYDFKVIEDPA